MEVLKILSALALIGLVAALGAFADPGRRIWASAARHVGTLAAGLTMTVHFVQLTAIRELWRSDELADYRLVWPSAIFAVEYLAWDVLVGLTMLLAAGALRAMASARGARRALGVGGSLCLVGTVGPLTGAMLLQNVAVVGYALVLPAAAALLVRVFARTPPSMGAS